MKGNTILRSAVILALGCAGTVLAQDKQGCASEALRLTSEIEKSTMADSAKAALKNDLSDAQSADLASCEQVVARVERELGMAPDESTASEALPPTEDNSMSGVEDDAVPDATNTDDMKEIPASSTDDDQSSTTGDSSSQGYEEGHASAEESLPAAPGASANDSSEAGVTATGEPDQGYASPQATSGDETPDAGYATPKTPDNESASTSIGANLLDGMSAKDLIDQPVTSATGEEVGQIDAIVTDKTAETNGFAVIGFGGVFGMGEKQVLLGLDKLQVSADGSIQVPANNDEDFEAYPKYVESNYDAYEGEIARLL